MAPFFWRTDRLTDIWAYRSSLPELKNSYEHLYEHLNGHLDENVKTQRNSTQLKATLKQLALELDIVAKWPTPHHHPNKQFILILLTLSTWYNTICMCSCFFYLILKTNQLIYYYLYVLYFFAQPPIPPHPQKLNGSHWKYQLLSGLGLLGNSNWITLDP